MGQHSRGVVRDSAQWQRRLAGTVATLYTLVLAGTLVLGAGAPAIGAPAPDYGVVVVPTEDGPPQSGHLAATRYLKVHPDATPFGTNDFGCRPTAAHPRPVVLAHGTDASVYDDWASIGPMLVQAGFCVFAPNYGGRPGGNSYGTEDVWRSVHQFSDFVDRVLDATGAQQVDLVGFSQGASITRYYTDKFGGASKVGQWVGLASPSYGGIMYGLVPIADAVPALWPAYQQVTSLAAIQQAEGAPFMRELNAGGDTVPGVRYTTVGSRVDEMIQPYTNIALHGPGAVNLLLQDLCPVDLTGHFQIVYDPFVAQLLLGILDPEQAAAPICRPVALGTGIPEVILGAHS